MLTSISSTRLQRLDMSFALLQEPSSSKACIARASKMPSFKDESEDMLLQLWHSRAETLEATVLDIRLAARKFHEDPAWRGNGKYQDHKACFDSAYLEMREPLAATDARLHAGPSSTRGRSAADESEDEVVEASAAAETSSTGRRAAGRAPPLRLTAPPGP
jgi:hypothetical protein